MLASVIAPRPVAPTHGFPKWNASLPVQDLRPERGVPTHEPMRLDLGHVQVRYALNGIATRSYALLSDTGSTVQLGQAHSRDQAITAAQGLLRGSANDVAFAVLQGAAGAWMVQKLVSEPAAMQAFTQPTGQGGLAGLQVFASDPALAAIVSKVGVYQPVALQQP